MATSNRSLNTFAPSHNANSATTYHRRIRSTPDAFLTSTTTPTIHEDHNENLAFYSSSVALAMSKPGTKFTGRSRTLPTLPPSIYPARTVPKHTPNRSTSDGGVPATRECYTTLKYPTTTATTPSSRPLPILPAAHAANNANIPVRPNVNTNAILPTPPVSPSFAPNVGPNTSFAQPQQRQQNPNPRRPLQNQQLPSPPSSGYSSPVNTSFYGSSIPFSGQGSRPLSLYNSSQSASIGSSVTSSSSSPSTRATTTSFSGSSSSYAPAQNTTIPSLATSISPPPATRTTTTSFSGGTTSYAPTQNTTIPSLATSVSPPATRMTTTSLFGRPTSYTSTQSPSMPSLPSSASSTSTTTTPFSIPVVSPSTAATTTTTTSSTPFSGSLSSYTSTQSPQIPALVTSISPTPSTAITPLQYDPSALFSSSHLTNPLRSQNDAEQSPSGPPVTRATGSTAVTVVQYNPLSSQEEQGPPVPPKDPPTSPTTSRIQRNSLLMRQPTTSAPPSYVPIQSPTSPSDPMQFPPPPPFQASTSSAPDTFPQDPPKARPSNQRQKSSGKGKAFAKAGLRIAGRIGLSLAKKAIVSTITGNVDVGSLIPTSDQIAELAAEWNPLEDGVEVEGGIDGEDMDVVVDVPVGVDTGDMDVGGGGEGDLAVEGADASVSPQPIYGPDTTNGYEMAPNMDQIASTGAHIAAHMLSPRRR